MGNFRERFKENWSKSFGKRGFLWATLPIVVFLAVLKVYHGNRFELMLGFVVLCIVAAGVWIITKWLLTFLVSVGGKKKEEK